MKVNAQAYITEIVDPTVAEFEKEPASLRRAFLACVVLLHTVDYLIAQPGSPSSGNLRKRFRQESVDFATVDRVAHAFKHVSTGHENSTDNKPLTSNYVFSRPRSFAGEMVPGLSFIGDTVGGVEIWNERGRDLLGIVKNALEFVRTKVQAQSPV